MIKGQYDSVLMQLLQSRNRLDSDIKRRGDCSFYIVADFITACTKA